MTRRKRSLLYGGGFFCVVAAVQWMWLSKITSPQPDVRQPPAEANRVVHPAGFSIVRPGRTRAIVLQASSGIFDQIAIVPDGGRSRYTPGLSVRRLREPPDLMRLQREGYQPGAFQQHDALIYNGPSGEYDDYRVMTERGGDWYEITLSLPSGGHPPGSIPSPEWRRYLETFAAAAPPAAVTQPRNE